MEILELILLWEAFPGRSGGTGSVLTWEATGFLQKNLKLILYQDPDGRRTGFRPSQEHYLFAQ